MLLAGFYVFEDMIQHMFGGTVDGRMFIVYGNIDTMDYGIELCYLGLFLEEQVLEVLLNGEMGLG